MVKASQGAVLDATLAQSAARPNSGITIETDSQGQPVSYEDGSQPGVVASAPQSADKDATGLKKGKKRHYGYRSYVTVDREDGYVRGVHTAPANEREVSHFDKALQSADIQAARVLADQGYAGAANRKRLKQRHQKSGIMRKAARNRPLTDRQKRANQLISKKRYLVEQCFGTMKRLFGMARARYFGAHKVNAQVLLKGLCMNLLKAANKITLEPPNAALLRPVMAVMS